MSRVIRPVSAARQRHDILSGIAASLRALSHQEVDEREIRDVIAFSTLALEKLQESVEATASAWEKRGYWVKADRFRADWEWLGSAGRELSDCMARGDWGAARACARTLMERLAGVEAMARKAGEEPWRGAWETWRARRFRRREE